MAILSTHCVVTSQCLQLCKQNLHQLFIYLLAITVWVYKPMIPKICPVLGSFFRAGNNITGGSNRGSGWWMGLIKWSKNIDEIQRPSLGPPWPSNCSKLIENTIGELSVKSQLTTHHYNKAIAIYCHQSFTHGFDRVGRNLLQKPHLPVLKEIQSGI